MFKQISPLLVVMIAVLTLSSGAYAAPIYYTFEGTTFYGGDDGGAVAAAGMSIVGSTVTYTFLADKDADNYTILYDGTTAPNFYVDNGYADYFYAKIVSPHPIKHLDGGYAPWQQGQYAAEIYQGYEDLGGKVSFRTGGNTLRSYLDNKNGMGIADWVVGTTGFEGYTMVRDEAGLFSSIYSNLTLTDISTINPYASVPEPSTLLLLGSGIAGLGFVRRRFKG